MQTDRTIQLLSVAVGRSGRARFVEEWEADLEAARSIGLSPTEILGAAARVAAFLLWIRVRGRVLRERRSWELLARGVVLGFVLVVADVPLDGFVPIVLPLVVIGLVRPAGCAARRWIAGAR